jgi:ribonuclease R
MLAQFQARYPTASLLSQLLTIYQGKFVVQVSVQIEGVVRSTGLAAAETIELAEDRARTRAIALLSDRETNLVENAFSLEKTSEGHWQLGVHIADVAHYVTPELVALDREGLKRGSAVYLGDTVLPMLPNAVLECCALLPERDRNCISVLITIDATSGQIVEFEIQPTVINVNQQLSENQALSFGDEVNSKLAQLLALSELIRSQRLQRGSFELKLPPRLNYYKDEGMLGAVVVTAKENEQASPALGSMVTEFVLLANQIVASHLQALGVPAIYRSQSAPDVEDVEEMIKLAGNLGAQLALGDNSVTPVDFQKFLEQFSTLPSEQVLNYLLQATLKNATYSLQPQPHFGLALEYYTRCTFPLRRYADLLIQRVLHTIFEQGRDRRTTRAKESVNLRHSSARGNISWNVLPTEIHQELSLRLVIVCHFRLAEQFLQKSHKTALQ